MSLQIRRGTDAERITITPLTGELLYTTDTKEVFVGDGSTLGGIPVSRYTDSDAKDAAADSLLNGDHDGLSFEYDSVTKAVSASITTFRATVFANIADRDAILVEPVVGQIILVSDSDGSGTPAFQGNTDGTIAGWVNLS